MDATRFDTIVSSLATHSRRGVVKSLAAIAAGGLLALLGIAEDSAARRRRRRRRRRPPPAPPDNCPLGCGFNELCAGNVCVPGCVFGRTPCSEGAIFNCCLAGFEVCHLGNCVQPCPSGQIRCGESGECCPTGDCVSGVCRRPCSGVECFFAYEVDASWQTTGNPEINQPNAIALDPAGNLYVVNSGKILKFTSGGVFVKDWTAPGYGVAVDGNTSVYVPNGGLTGKYDTEGVFSRYLSTSGLSGAQDAAVDGEGNVYIVDSINDRVFVFDSSGAKIDDWDAPAAPQGPGPMSFPDGIAVDDVDGHVYVADTFNNRILKFDLDGNFDRAWGGAGNCGQPGRPPCLNHPTGLALDSDGNLFIADFQNDLIQVFESDSGFITTFGDGGTDPLRRPTGVAVDAAGNVFVTDFVNERVMKFKPASGTLRGGQVAAERRGGKDAGTRNGSSGQKPNRNRNRSGR